VYSGTTGPVPWALSLGVLTEAMFHIGALSMGALIVTSRCKCFLKVFVNVGLAVVCTNIFVVIKAESCHSEQFLPMCAPRTELYGSDTGGLRYDMLAVTIHLLILVVFVRTSLTIIISYVLRVFVENCNCFLFKCSQWQELQFIFPRLLMLSVSRIYSADNRMINESGAGG
jgi:hypothetical protein